MHEAVQRLPSGLLIYIAPALDMCQVLSSCAGNLLKLYARLAGLGVWLHRRRQQGSASRFESFDKYDSGAAVGAMSGPTNVYASSKFGGRMVYPDMEEVEMGSGPAARQQSPKSFQSVNLKSGRKLDLP